MISSICGVNKKNIWVATFQLMVYYSPYTPLKTNMFPENRWLEGVFPTEMVPF